jgi:DNA-binding GntR family transcriptional regulator
VLTSSIELKTRGARAAEIADALREQIVSGALTAGAPLRQDQLAQAFGSSRMPVREALQSLQQEGFVFIEPNRGAVVADLDAAEIREIYEMRTVAECLALRKAIPDLTNRQIDEARRIQDETERLPIERFSEGNKRFHMTLYAPSARPRLLAHVSGLADLADRYVRVAVDTLNYDNRSHEEHRQLLEACMRRDADEACEILRHHIDDAGVALTTWLERRFG